MLERELDHEERTLPPHDGHWLPPALSPGLLRLPKTEATATTDSTAMMNAGADQAGSLRYVGKQQLDRDGREDHRQGRPQVANPVLRPGQQEVQRAHAEQREHVGRVDDEGVGGDGEHRRNGVDGEDHIGGLHDEQGHQ